ncbi:MAG TPA: hypothetical protein VIC84_20635 [Blastocatellia bacterium]|jgi:hypothetical protein
MAAKSNHGKSKSASKPKRGGNRRKTSADMVDVALRQTEALRLRQAGNTFEQIATKLRYSDPSGARNAVLAALRENVTEPNAEMRALELARLDALHAALWSKARLGDLGAVDRVLKLMERRAKMLGLDARQAVDVSVEDRSRTMVECAITAMMDQAQVSREEAIEQLTAIVPEMRTWIN